MKRKGYSIKWKLFFFFALLTIAMIGVPWFSQTIMLERFYKFIKTRQIVSAAETIAQNIDNSDVGELIASIAQNDNICILVSDGENNLFSEEVLSGCYIHHMPKSAMNLLIEKTLAHEGLYLEKSSRENVRFKPAPRPGNLQKDRRAAQSREFVKIESLVCVKTVEMTGGKPCYILINSNISPVGSTVETLRIQLVYITIALLLVAFALALIASKLISKPVIRINEAAKELSKGNYDVRFDVHGFREIEQLSQTLNSAAAELSKVENLRRELIANVSHDLRTPLTMITGFAEVMRDLPGENTPENAQVIIDESNRLTRLVADLLDLSKLQSDANVLEREVFCITKSIADTVKRISSLLDHEKIEIVFDSAEDAFVLADELQISQVVYNLLSNAITHTAQNTKVEISQTIADGKVRIEIMDNGPGIDKTQLAYIWDRYYKVDKSHTRPQVGTGLGLSIAKSVLEQHGANFGADSEIDKGSIFWFELPLEEDPPN